MCYYEHLRPYLRLAFANCIFYCNSISVLTSNVNRQSEWSTARGFNLLSQQLVLLLLTVGSVFFILE